VAKPKGPKPPREVAELGRPETPEETAARKAENSRLYRSRKTVNNLIYSLLATLGVVALIFFAVPRPDVPQNWEIDYVAVGADAQASVNGPLSTPVMPTGWRANVAVLGRVDGLPSWKVNFLTPSDDFITYEQVFGADEAGIGRILGGRSLTGEFTFGTAQMWSEFDNTSGADAGVDEDYALATSGINDVFILHGTGSKEEFAEVAQAISEQMGLVRP
jgi:hypothetical protein